MDRYQMIDEEAVLKKLDELPVKEDYTTATAFYKAMNRARKWLRSQVKGVSMAGKVKYMESDVHELIRKSPSA